MKKKSLKFFKKRKVSIGSTKIVGGGTYNPCQQALLVAEGTGWFPEGEHGEPNEVFLTLWKGC